MKPTQSEWPTGMPTPPKDRGIREMKPFIGQGCRPHATQYKKR